MKSIIEVLLNLVQYFDELVARIDSITFSNTVFTTYIGYVRYLMGETVWGLLMTVFYISVVILLFKVIKSFVEFVSNFIPMV